MLTMRTGIRIAITLWLDSLTKAFLHVPLIPNHVHVSRIQNERLLGQQSHAAAYLQEDGLHYVDLWTGTPPQRQTLIIGTATPRIAFPCSNCLDCGMHNNFNELKSLTFKMTSCEECSVGHCNSHSLKCEAGFTSTRNGWTGFEAQDMAYIGGPHQKALANGERELHFEMNFICQTSITGKLKAQLADGVLGLAPSEDSYWFQAKKSTRSQDSSFSVCFARPGTAYQNGTEAGTLTMGGTDKRLHASEMVYGSFTGKFNLGLKSLSLKKGGGGTTARSIPIVSDRQKSDSHQIPIDSEVTETYLPFVYKKSFQTIWQQLTGMYFQNNPMRLSELELNSLPTVLLRFSGFEEDLVVAMGPTNYMKHDGDGYYSNRLYFERHHQITLGSNFLLGHDVHFDIDKGRIGFAESKCDYLSVMEVDSSEKQEIQPTVRKEHRPYTTAKPETRFAIKTGHVWAISCVAAAVVALYIGKRQYKIQQANYQATHVEEIELQDCPNQKTALSTAC